jgi:hypothetical protein
MRAHINTVPDFFIPILSKSTSESSALKCRVTYIILSSVRRGPLAGPDLGKHMVLVGPASIMLLILDQASRQLKIATLI